MFKTIGIIYQTTIHLALIAAVFLYTSNDYTLAKMDHAQEQVSYNTDDYNALLDSHLRKRSK
jgi:hypothetical protein